MELEIERNLNIGCPQGSASGPWFCKISYIGDDIFDIQLEEDDKIEGFCDDTTRNTKRKLMHLFNSTKFSTIKEFKRTR